LQVLRSSLLAACRRHTQADYQWVFPSDCPYTLPHRFTTNRCITRRPLFTTHRVWFTPRRSTMRRAWCTPAIIATATIVIEVIEAIADTGVSRFFTNTPFNTRPQPCGRVAVLLPPRATRPVLPQT
jgi:hypothetical protein